MRRNRAQPPDLKPNICPLVSVPLQQFHLLVCCMASNVFRQWHGHPRTQAVSTTTVLPFFKIEYLFTWLFQVLAVCGMWDLVPWPWLKPRPPTLGWASRKVPWFFPYMLGRANTVPVPGFPMQLASAFHANAAPDLLVFLCLALGSFLLGHVSLCPHRSFLVHCPNSTYNHLSWAQHHNLISNALSSFLIYL